MKSTGVAKLFRNGRSQAVRLPREFRFEGDSVRISKVAGGVLLQPMIPDVKKWFEEMDAFGADDLFKGGRNQPVLRPRKIFD